jgi:hypothetical protein
MATRPTAMGNRRFMFHVPYLVPSCGGALKSDQVQ